MSEGTKRNISVVKDADGNKIVVINDIISVSYTHLCTVS